MCDKNGLNRLEDKISACRVMLYDVQTFVRFGALAADSAITDEELQLRSSSDDYYILLRTINQKLEKAVEVLQT